ncbi:hypothetical protein [Herbiconiux liangxiaofengii]|uniref:hypothetical protein n=1 Tax=Herbiconiux liangxiaofengii TaxID=3342795 RepID=UPI0035BB792B
MNRRIRILSALLAAVVAGIVTLASAGPALAVRAVSHGHGVLWSGDRTSWIGSYALDDGNSGYCTDVERPQPSGTELEYVDGSTTGRYSLHDSALLAFISRNFGSPTDPLTAASAQLATWTVTGLGGHDQAYFARRANAAAGDVLAAANRILGWASAPGGASTGVSASVNLELAGAGGSVHSDLAVDYLAGSQTVPAGSFAGTMTLEGAAFDDGSRSRTVRNGETLRIAPDQQGATETVSVQVDFRDLPFGPGFRFGRNTGASQDLLVDHPYTRDAHASASRSGPNELPFRPRVETQTSAAVAEAGALLGDDLIVDTHPESATGTEWGVYRTDTGAEAPIPVVIESVLHGPFPVRPLESEVAPADGPVVCRVETLVEAGPGRYETPECVLPAAGHYVWTDSIDPHRTPPEQGGDRLQAWQSRFGVATETTLVPATVLIETVASSDLLAAPGCVFDRLSVTGLPPGSEPIQVQSTLLGPLPRLPEPGSVPDDWQSFPEAGSVVTEVAADGEHRSPCIEVTKPGHYYFTVSSDGSPTVDGDGTFAAAGTTADGGQQLVPPFSDLRVHEAESVVLTPPAASPPPPTPTPTPTPTPPATSVPSAPPVAAALAQTGRSGSGAVAIAAEVSMVAVGLAIAGLAGSHLTSRRRR